jgi:hypothetical protein
MAAERLAPLQQEADELLAILTAIVRNVKNKSAP